MYIPVISFDQSDKHNLMCTYVAIVRSGVDLDVHRNIYNSRIEEIITSFYAMIYIVYKN